MLQREERLKLDLLVLHSAQRSSEEYEDARRGLHGHGAAESCAHHLSCLKALATAVAAPSSTRPTFLPQAMALYRQVGCSMQANANGQCRRHRIGLLSRRRRVLQSAPSKQSSLCSSRPLFCQEDLLPAICHPSFQALRLVFSDERFSEQPGSWKLRLRLLTRD